MELRHLRYFTAIVEEGSFSEAARNRLHTSQPSLSRQIRELEAELDVALLDRGGQGVKPTAAGLVFFDHARRILEQIQNTIDATRNAEHTLRVGCLPGLEQQVLMRLHEIAASQSPTFAFKVIGATSPNLREHMREGLLDMAFVWPDEETSHLHSVVVSHQEIVAVFRASHPLSKTSIVSLEQLQKERFISLDPMVAPGFWTAIQNWFQGQGLNLTPDHMAGNFLSAMSLIQSTGGFLLMPEFARNLIPEGFVILNLLNPPPAIAICLVYRPASQSSVAWIVELIAKHWTPNHR